MPVVHHLEVLLILLAILGGLSVLAARLRFPLPILLVLAGLAIGFVPRLPELRLDPELVFVIFLPPLIFSAAWNFPWHEFRKNFTPIFTLAVGLVLVTMAAVALTAWWLVPGMTLAAGFVLGAIVSPPDAVAASAILRPLNVPRRLLSVLEGESLVNDSSGLVAYQFAVAAVVTGSFSLAQAGSHFVWGSLAGSLVGWGIGFAAERLHRQIKDPAVEIALTILTPYAAYLAAEHLDVSGILACVVAGLFIGHRSWRALTPESRLQRDAVWKFIEFLLNGLVFILIGLEFPVIAREMTGISLGGAILCGVIISGVVIAVRFLLLPPAIWAERLFSRRAPDPSQTLSLQALIVGSWAGMRGAVSMAAALALPLTTQDGADFPGRRIILCVTFCVIFITLVGQGLCLPWLVKWLGVAENPELYQTEARARMDVIRSIIAEIDRMTGDSPSEEERTSLNFWRNHYLERLASIETRLDLVEHNPAGLPSREKFLFPLLMEHARRHLVQLRTSGQISEEVRRQIEYDLDLEQQRIERIIFQL